MSEQPNRQAHQQRSTHHDADVDRDGMIPRRSLRACQARTDLVFVRALDGCRGRRCARCLVVSPEGRRRKVNGIYFVSAAPPVDVVSKARGRRNWHGYTL